MTKFYKYFLSLVCALITICFFSAASSYASEVTIFGPQKFIRTTGDPDVYTGNFTGLFTDEIPSGKLVVLNGNQTGENRIEDAISSKGV